MKKLFSIYIVCILMFTSCDILDQEPKSQITVKNAWITENDVIGELHGAYALIRKALIGLRGGYNHWFYGDFRFRDITVRTYDQYIKSLNFKAEYYAIEPLSRWCDFYTAIVQCNLLIEKIPTIKKTEFLQYKPEHYISEARFLRAFLYFYISRVWGDVPLQKEAINHDPLPREKMATVLEFALTDIKEAVKHLPWEYSDELAKVRAVRATKGAAYALEASIHMWNKKYDLALNSTTQVIQNLDKSHYDLLAIDNSDDIIKGKSIEGIFEIDFDEQWNEINNKTLANLTLCKTPWVDRPSYWSAVYIEKDTLASLFPDTDPDKRRNLWFQDHDSRDPMIIKFKNETQERFKFQDNIIIFRLAGLYLLRAEALTHQGQTGEAIEYLNKVRLRAEATLYTESEGDLETAIIRERRKELIGEGHAFYDMYRTGRLSTYMSSTYNEENLNQGAWTMPVHKTAFTTNGLLKQYPFWE